MFFNLQQFNKTVEAAKAKAPEMTAQIDKAAETLLSNPFIHDDGRGLLIAGETGVYYAKANACTCKAAEFHRVCYHRIADRLVRLYNSRQGH